MSDAMEWRLALAALVVYLTLVVGSVVMVAYGLMHPDECASFIR